MTARNAASVTSAVRQPCSSISQLSIGMKMVLAKPAISVTAVSARVRLALEPGGHHGEGRLVEHRRHHDPDQRPDDVELEQAC